MHTTSTSQMRATQAALETTTAIPCGDGAAEIPDSTLALEPADTSALIERLKALADATRLRMLTLLAAQPQPLCVCDITSQFNQRQPTISHHLRILRQAGLIACEKRGVWAYYWATDAGRRCLAAARALA